MSFVKFAQNKTKMNHSQLPSSMSFLLSALEEHAVVDWGQPKHAPQNRQTALDTLNRQLVLLAKFFVATRCYHMANYSFTRTAPARC